MLPGNSSARLRSRVAEIEPKSWMRSAMAATGESGNSRRFAAMAGSAKRVSRTPPSSRGLRIRFCRRLRMRSMSRTPLSWFCNSVARPGAVTNSPTQFWRRLISPRSSSGAQSQRSIKRAPGAVTVPSIAARREPWRVLAADLKISKLRSVAGSSRRVRSLLYSLIFRRFSGLAQRVSVA